MISYCFLASKVPGGVSGGIIGSIMSITIVAIICFITVGIINEKYCKRKNVSSYNTQKVELQTPRTTQTRQSRPTSVPSNQSRQPNPSKQTTLTSQYPVVQTSRQQTSNVDNCGGSSDVQHYADNPAYKSDHVEKPYYHNRW